jgi:pimeloyl-ACP methyl ester carboxylesterase
LKDGHELATRQERPLLVLLPGMDGTGDLFEPFVRAVDNRFDTKIVRYPTHERLGYEELTDLVASELPLQRPFVLLGESFSGPVAISIAARKPKYLVGLVLCCTFAKNPLPTFAALGRIVLRLPLPRPPLRLIEFALAGNERLPGELRHTLHDSLAKVSIGALRTRAKAALYVNAESELRRLTVPTIYLRATRDRVVGKHIAKQMQEQLSSLRIVDFDAPHFLLQTKPNEAAHAVTEFMRKIQA